MDWNQEILWGNSPKDYFIALAVILVAAVVFRVLMSFAKKWSDRISEQSDTKIGRSIMNIIRSAILPFLYIVVISLAIQLLHLDDTFQKILKVAMVFITVFFVTRILILILQTFIDYYFIRKGRSEESKELNGVFLIIQIFLWIIGLVILLGNLGYDIRTVLAGMGVGGIAIALGAQNIITDVIAYISILFDNPFSVGDYLKIGDDAGNVKYIGIKTTRIQSDTGEELIFSNRLLLDKTIRNYAGLTERRMAFEFYVQPDTPVEKLEIIPENVKKVILTQPKVRIERIHLMDIKDFGFRFQVVYYSLERGYNICLDKQQNIHLGIYHKLNEMDVKFAFSGQSNISIQTMPPSNE